MNVTHLTNMRISMKNLLASVALFAFLTIPAQGAFAWTYDGIGSLNPFTLFGTRTAKCGCEKPKLTKCEKLHGVKIKKERGTACGCAAPVEYVKIVPMQGNTCTNCQRAF